jgi:hypothetical protein
LPRIGPPSDEPREEIPVSLGEEGELSEPGSAKDALGSVQPADGGSLSPGSESSVRVVQAHPATNAVWGWLLRGGGMRLTPEKHEEIKSILLDIDELLHKFDRETSNQDSEQA